MKQTLSRMLPQILQDRGKPVQMERPTIFDQTDGDLESGALILPFIQNGFDEIDILLCMLTEIGSSPIKNGFFGRPFADPFRIFSPLR